MRLLPLILSTYFVEYTFKCHILVTLWCVKIKKTIHFKYIVDSIPTSQAGKDVKMPNIEIEGNILIQSHSIYHWKAKLVHFIRILQSIWNRQFELGIFCSLVHIFFKAMHSDQQGDWEFLT